MTDIAAGKGPEWPSWFATAHASLGVSEIPGARHSPVILAWARRLGSRILGIAVKDDETPWCGLFMAHAFEANGILPPKIAVRASAWGSWGRQLNNPRLGCVLVFTRNGGGHVGLYAGEDSKYYYVLGGNQSNKVSYTWIAKSRLANGGMRWPFGPPLPVFTRPLLVNRAGQPISTNEA